LPLSGDRIRASVDASLARLARQRIEVLSLHDADADEVARDDVLRALEDVKTAGKIERIGIASSPPAVRAALSASAIYDVVQVAHNVYTRGLEAVAAALPPNRAVLPVIHSVYGSSGLITRTAAAIDRDPDLAASMAAAGYDAAPATAAADFLLDFALAANREGIVLISALKPAHLSQALSRERIALDPGAIAGLAARLVPAARDDAVPNAG
jgi:aryl-alcohol dehydrogenase-like predicted oxidoreductase